jgi:hypothetical protein
MLETTPLSNFPFIPGLDPTQDTPVEILHTILLGIVKYTWHNLHSSWNDAQQDLFVVQLESTNIDGLSVPPIRAAYMMQYRNGLIGKHFKTLMQTMTFHVHDLVTADQFTLVKAIGSLSALLWISEIQDLEGYLVRFLLQIWLDNKMMRHDMLAWLG